MMNVSSWSIRNPIPAVMLFIMLTVWGLMGFGGMKIQNFPDIDLPTITVSAALPGASPAQLETEVARKMENSIATLQGIKHIYTKVQDGSVFISVEFRLEKPTQEALLICAWLVAFFPVLSNTTQGLRSTDHNLLNLFELYKASSWQTLFLLKLPNALPYFLAGLQIAGGLSLIAAVVAEFAAGSSGAGSGLAFRLLEAGYRLNIPRLFAALVLLSVSGIAIYGATSLISWLLLRKWHESAVRREN